MREWSLSTRHGAIVQPPRAAGTHQYSRWWKRCTRKRSENGLTRLKFSCPTSFMVRAVGSIARGLRQLSFSLSSTRSATTTQHCREQSVPS
jgi:hypothetical protein